MGPPYYVVLDTPLGFYEIPSYWVHKFAIGRTYEKGDPVMQPSQVRKLIYGDGGLFRISVQVYKYTELQLNLY